MDHVKKSDEHTQVAFMECKPKRELVRKTWLHDVAQLEWFDVMLLSAFATGNTTADEIIAQRDDFDLKANALGKWAE